MRFFGEIPGIRCKRKIHIPPNESKPYGLTSTTEFECYCPFCKEKFFVTIFITANK
jgi:hypothetical protein